MVDEKISIQDEALLNELKGNLFEFLVASKIARAKGIEGTFLRNFNSNFKKQLSLYESRLRQLNPSLVISLPKLADATFAGLMKRLPDRVDHIEVIGKISTGHTWSEADLLLGSENQKIPISLKLCRSNSYINTKSAGVKSFLSKYFADFELAIKLQNELNSTVDKAFDRLGHELYEMEGLHFEGRFDNGWELSDRPGQLSEEMRKSIHACYYRIIEQIYRSLIELKQVNVPLFGEALLPLIGLGNRDILQATCFYEGDYQLREVSFLSGYELNLDQIEISTLKEKVSSLEIRIGGIRLQIRVKPMNKFTTPAFKVNCSIRK